MVKTKRSRSKKASPKPVARGKKTKASRAKGRRNPEELIDVRCQCGWGRLNCPEGELPTECPVCHATFGEVCVANPEEVVCIGCNSVLPATESYSPGDEALCAACDTEITGRAHNPDYTRRNPDALKTDLMGRDHDHIIYNLIGELVAAAAAAKIDPRAAYNGPITAVRGYYGPDTTLVYKYEPGHFKAYGAADKAAENIYSEGARRGDTDIRAIGGKLLRLVNEEEWDAVIQEAQNLQRLLASKDPPVFGWNPRRKNPTTQQNLADAVEREIKQIEAEGKVSHPVSLYQQVIRHALTGDSSSPVLPAAVKAFAEDVPGRRGRPARRMIYLHIRSRSGVPYEIEIPADAAEAFVVQQGTRPNHGRLSSCEGCGRDTTSRHGLCSACSSTRRNRGRRNGIDAGRKGWDPRGGSQDNYWACLHCSAPSKQGNRLCDGCMQRNPDWDRWSQPDPVAEYERARQELGLETRPNPHPRGALIPPGVSVDKFGRVRRTDLPDSRKWWRR